MERETTASTQKTSTNGNSASSEDDISVMRQVLINGSIPFTEAGEIKFITKEPNQVQSTYIRDDLGYHTSPYVFYFQKGENTLTLKATAKAN